MHLWYEFEILSAFYGSGVKTESKDLKSQTFPNMQGFGLNNENKPDAASVFSKIIFLTSTFPQSILNKLLLGLKRLNKAVFMILYKHCMCSLKCWHSVFLRVGCFIQHNKVVFMSFICLCKEVK